MSQPLTTHQRANSISTGIFLISLGILFYTNYWWPGILLALAVTVGVKEYLRGRIYDLVLSVVILGGLFVFFYFSPNWSVAVPVLFTIAGIWIIFREYFVRKPRSSEDIAVDISQEVSEEEKRES